MSTTISCPETQVWRPFTLGQLPAPELEQLAKHLAGCPQCAGIVQAMTVRDPRLDSTRAQEAARVQPTAVVPKAAGDGLSGPRTPAHDFHLGTTQVRPVLDAHALHPFLKPAQTPEELGRLGNYRVLKQLGEGGGGLVYLAEDILLQRPVALKVLKPEVAHTPLAAERFLREARAAAGIEHEHIVTIHQVGEDGGVLYLAMQLLRGESLQDRLLRDGTLPQHEVLRIGREIANGLDAAHGRGLIHRDIKPANIWLEDLPGRSCRVKILDFGMARHSEETERFTRVGFVVGTPAYMSPEQAQDLAVGPTSDLFSLGCVMYQLLTGQQPFYRPTLQATMAALVLEQPTPPHEVNPETSQALSDLVMWLLLKNPLDRPSSAQAVVEAMEAMEHGMRVKGKRQPVSAVTFPAAAPVGARSPYPVGARSPDRAALPSRYRQYITQGLLFLATISLVAVIALRLTATEGELVFQTDDPKVTDLIEQAGVTLYDFNSDRRYSLQRGQSLPPGNYQLEAGAPDSGLMFDPKSFAIERGKKTTIRVWQEKKGREHF